MFLHHLNNMNNRIKLKMLRRISVLLICTVIISALTGCGSKNYSYGLSPDDPVEVVIWLTGSEKRSGAYEEMIKLFNETEGKNRGIVVSSVSFGGDDKLSEEYIKDKEAGNDNLLPDMIEVSASNSLLYDSGIQYVDMNNLIADNTKQSIYENLLNAGSYGRDKQLRLLPVVKDTTVMAVDLTRWNDFKKQKEHYLNELDIWEGLDVVGETFYNTTGKSLYGLSSISQYMLVGSRQLGTGILSIENGKPVIRADGDVMKTLWQNYYGAFIRGGMYSYSKDKVEDLQSGRITIAAINSSETERLSTSTATEGDAFYLNEYQIIPYPQFKGMKKICPVDNTGVAILNKDDKKNIGCMLFLEWLLQDENNMHLACSAGGVPVNNRVSNPDYFEEYLDNNKTGMSSMDVSTMRISLEMMSDAEIYAAPMCDIYNDLTDYLDDTMSKAAHEDRNVVDDKEGIGIGRQEAIDKYVSDEHFGVWINEFRSGIQF